MAKINERIMHFKCETFALFQGTKELLWMVHIVSFIDLVDVS